MRHTCGLTLACIPLLHASVTGQDFARRDRECFPAACPDNTLMSRSSAQDGTGVDVRPCAAHTLQSMLLGEVLARPRVPAPQLHLLAQRLAGGLGHGPHALQ